MPRRSARPRPVALAVAAVACALTGLASLPSPASASRLVGGRQQSAITRAFFRQRGSRGKVIVSIRSAAVSPAWSVVRWVTPTPAGGRGTRPSGPGLHSAYFHAVGGAQLPGRPPAKVTQELAHAFRVTLLYTGSGRESVSYNQIYRSVCSGGGGFIEQERDTVAPSWRVRYSVDLDRLLSAVRGPQGVALVPTVSFDPAGSQLRAVQTTSRMYVDQGCFNRPTNYRCVTTFRLTGGGGNALSFLPGLGTEVGIPMHGIARGRCAPEDYTLGPSLWDSGAATAIVRALGLAGGHLPANPYAQLAVSWPRNAVAGGLASPCQGISSGCSDQLRWRGSVRLEPDSG